MSDVVERAIKRAGAMWEDVRDRTHSPVLITLGERHGTVWELTLEKGAHHPHWTISERELTDAEWAETDKVDRIGTLKPMLSPHGTHFEVTAFIRNGRKPMESGWNVTGEPVDAVVYRGEKVAPQGPYVICTLAHLTNIIIKEFSYDGKDPKGVKTYQADVDAASALLAQLRTALGD